VQTPETTVVEQFYAAFARGDLPAVLAAVDPEVEWVTPESLPWSRGAYRGRDGLADYFASFDEALQDARVEPHEMHPLPGGRVIAFGFERAKARVTGVQFEARFAHLWTIRHGTVLAMRGLIDTAAITAAFAR
jgi:ketosteroid isomerase-like protein